MASPVSICSNALILLGDKPIASFTDGSKAAQVAANLYPDAKRDFLRGHPWNAAIKRATLAPLADAPEHGFANQFQLPADFLRMLEVVDGQEFKIEGRRALANTTVLRIKYVAETPEDTWDAGMVSAMTMHMAALMALPITESATKAEAIAQTAERAVRRAKAIDGMEDTPDSIEDDPLYRSRFPGGGW